MQSKYHHYPPKAHHARKLSSGVAIPRNWLHPTRIAAVAIVVLIILFFNFPATSSIPRTRSSEDKYDDRSAVAGGRGAQSGKQASTVDAPLTKKKNVAIVTFTTQQKSFTHLSLKNHVYYARKHGYDFLVDYEQHNTRGAMWHKFAMIEDAIQTNKYDWVWWMDFDTLITNTNIKVEDVIAEELANVTNPNAIDFLFTPDCFALNAGSFFTRGHSRSIKFFDRVREYHTANTTKEHQLSEQDCMRDIMFPAGSLPKRVLPLESAYESPEEAAESSSVSSMSEVAKKYPSTSKTTTWVPESEFAERFIVIPQWRINAFPEEIKCWDERDSPKRGWEKGSFVIHFAGAWAHMKREDPTGYLMEKYAKDIIWE